MSDMSLEFNNKKEDLNNLINNIQILFNFGNNQNGDQFLQKVF